MLNFILLPLAFYFVKGAIKQQKTCYDGYVLNRSNLCTREIDEAPQPTCSAGELDGKGCRVRIPKIIRCSEGYTMDPATNTCSYTLPSDFQYFCPTGFSDNGDDCIMSTPGAVTEYCEDSERVGDKCIRFLRADKVITVDCPEDSIKEDDSCWKVAESFDCSENLLKAASDILRSRKHRSLAGGDGLTPATPPAQFKTVIVSQGCEKRYEVPSIVTQFCPENFVADSKGCFLEEAVPLQSKCVSTGGSVADCPPVIRKAAKIAKCPNGSNGVKGKCLEVIKGDAIRYCPTDFDEVGDMCEKFIEITRQCPQDLIYKNGRCIGRKTHTPIVVGDQAAATEGGSISGISLPLRIPFKEPRSMKLFK